MDVSKDKVYQYLDGIGETLTSYDTNTELPRDKRAIAVGSTMVPDDNETFGSGTQSAMQQKIEDVKTVSQDISYDDIKVVKVRKYRLYKKG